MFHLQKCNITSLDDKEAYRKIEAKQLFMPRRCDGLHQGHGRSQNSKFNVQLCVVKI